jgi:hypothetical protein
LESLDKILAPLKQQGNVKEAEKAVDKAEKEWGVFLEKERKRTHEIERPKMVKRKKADVEAQIEETKTRWSEGALGGEGFGGRWKGVKRAVERALIAGGASVEIDSAEKSTWKAIMKEAIEGVDAEDRKKYAAARSNVEAEIKRLRTSANAPVEASEQSEVCRATSLGSVLHDGLLNCSTLCDSPRSPRHSSLPFFASHSLLPSMHLRPNSRRRHQRRRLPQHGDTRLRSSRTYWNGTLSARTRSKVV